MSREEIQNIIISYLRNYEPDRISLFGSFARGESTSSSDIDLLVSFKHTQSLLQLVRIEKELSDRTGYKVDLLTEGALKNKTILKNIQKDLHVIYERR